MKIAGFLTEGGLPECSSMGDTSQHASGSWLMYMHTTIKPLLLKSLLLGLLSKAQHFDDMTVMTFRYAKLRISRFPVSSPYAPRP